jgi:hypothetical protein
MISRAYEPKTPGFQRINAAGHMREFSLFVIIHRLSPSRREATVAPTLMHRACERHWSFE